MKYKGGIEIESELKAFQEKAKKYDQLRSLSLEEVQMQRRRKQIGQERAKLLGITEKYKEVAK